MWDQSPGVFPGMFTLQQSKIGSKQTCAYALHCLLAA